MFEQKFIIKNKFKKKENKEVFKNPNKKINLDETIEAVIKKLFRGFRQCIKNNFHEKYGRKPYGWVDRTFKHMTKQFF
jgi:hypothetical protein